MGFISNLGASLLMISGKKIINKKQDLDNIFKVSSERSSI